MSDSVTTRQVRACLVGKTGAGKSALCNILCPGVTFKTSSSAGSVTKEAQRGTYHHETHHIELTLLDTMGFADTSHSQTVVRQKITDGLKAMVGGVNFFFLVIKKERFTKESYQIVNYLFMAVLGKKALDNLWLVVTHSGDLVEDQEAQAEWIRESRATNDEFATVVRMVGADRLLFVENDTSKNPRMELVCAERRATAKELLLEVMQANTHAPFVIQALEQAQKAFDEQKAAAKAKRKAQKAKHQKQLTEAASEVDREKARAALEIAKLEHELALEKARREYDAKAHEETVRRMEQAKKKNKTCFLS